MVESKKGNALGSEFTLSAEQVTTLTEEPKGPRSGAAARRPK